MQRAQLAKVVQQEGDLFELVRDHLPIVVVLLHLLSTYS